MAIIAKMYVDDQIINLIDFSISFSQRSDETGRPTSKSQLQTIWAVFQTTKDTSLYAWSITSFQLKEVTVILTAEMENGKSKEYEFYDVACTFYKEEFNGVNSSPALTTIGMEAAIFKYQDFYHEKYWKVTDINNRVSTTIQEDQIEEKKVIDYYITDLNNKRINKVLIGDKIVLNVFSRNMLGEMLNIKLDNQSVDFKYNGEILANDLLHNYRINSNLEKVELEAVKQEI
jgi:hypothetical protein